MYNKKILKSKIITIIIVSLFLHIILPLSAFAEEEINLDESFTVLEEQEAVTEVDLIETDEISSEEILDEIVEEPESDEIVEEIEDMIEETSLSEEEALDEETIESKVEETLVEEPESDDTVEEIEDTIEETSSSEEMLDEEIIESKVEEVLVEETESSKVEEVIDKIASLSETEEVLDEKASLSEAEELLDEKASPSDIKEATTSNIEEIIQLEVTVNTLIGTWTIDGITSYRFDIDGNGAMILPSHSYSFEYELESDNLLLRFEDSRIEDAAFTPSIEDDVLILEKKQELGVSKYKLSRQ